MILESDQSRKFALRYVYLSWHEIALKILLKSGASLTDAEDSIQEAVIVFDNSIRHNKYAQLASLKNYFIGICKGRLFSNRRSTKRIDLVEELTEFDEINPVHPETLMIADEEKKVIATMLDQLDENCQEILRLYRLSYSMKEIGHQIGLDNTGTVRQRVFQCRKKLKAIVSKNPLFSNYFKQRHEQE